MKQLALFKKRSKADIKRRQTSDKSFKIQNPNGSVFAEMSNGKWIKKPKEIK